jgi:hypothetical protein
LRDAHHFDHRRRRRRLEVGGNLPIEGFALLNDASDAMTLRRPQRLDDLGNVLYR